MDRRGRGCVVILLSSMSLCCGSRRPNSSSSTRKRVHEGCSSCPLKWRLSHNNIHIETLLFSFPLTLRIFVEKEKEEEEIRGGGRVENGGKS